MSVHRVHQKTKWTTIENVSLTDRNLSLKALGLFVRILSLPPTWDFSEQGLAAICKDGITAVRTALHELEELGYLSRGPIRSEDGRVVDWFYDFYEDPQDNPKFENPDLENLSLDNQTELNTKEINNTKELNTKEYGRVSKKFVPPTLDEINAYISEKSLGVDGKQFFDYFTAGNWVDSRGNKVKNWKQKLLTWNKFNGSSARPQKPSVQDSVQYYSYRDNNNDFPKGFKPL